MQVLVKKSDGNIPVNLTDDEAGAAKVRDLRDVHGQDGVVLHDVSDEMRALIDPVVEEQAEQPADPQTNSPAV